MVAALVAAYATETEKAQKMTGEFRCCQIDVPIVLTKPTELQFFGDVHAGAPGAHMGLFEQLIKDAVTRKAWLFGMGDIFEMLSGSERAHLRQQLHESTDQILNDVMMNEVIRVANILRPAKERILGMIEGNHYGELLDGRTTTQALCENLGVPYLGNMALVQLNLKAKDGECAKLTICTHHGTGTSQVNPLLAVKRLELTAMADIYVMGHDHSLAAEKQARLKLHINGKTGEVKVKERPVLFLRSGSFLRAYLDRERSYIVKRALKPSALGSPVVEITTRRQMADGVRHIVTEFKAVI